jgi:Xaa-Pro aminopeptidase
MENNQVQLKALNLNNNSQENSVAEFKQRRNTLLNLVAQNHKEPGPCVFFASFDYDSKPFTQESSFYYLTGLENPGLTLMLKNNKSTIFGPEYLRDPLLWTDHPLITKETVHNAGFDEYAYLGNPIEPGTTCALCDNPEEFTNLINSLKQSIQEQKKIYTLNSVDEGHSTEHISFLYNLMNHVPGMESSIEDIFDIVARMRRTKSAYEIQKIQNSIDLSIKAFNSIAALIKPGLRETMLKAEFESVLTQDGAGTAYYPIIASGDTIHLLHPQPKPYRLLQNGDLVLIDAGAKLDNYCADLTRTFPIGGTFTPRQKEIYKLVLATQKVLASAAKPGIWIRNKNEQEKSLDHIAKKYLNENGNYDPYLLHGASHFLGLDVHDVGNWDEPLKEGDVITIEPGIYIPQERIGIRIEDNYVITQDGVRCLSAQLPKTVEEIENYMKIGRKE